MGSMKLCRKCGIKIEGDWAEQADYHVGCFPDFERMPGFEMTGFDIGLKEDLTEIIRWANNNSGRSQQVALGCSEVGQECDLKLAYRMANIPTVHHSMDPWPAIVGTSVHAWMERAVNDFQGVHGTSRWLTELSVYPSTIMAGHTDLYDSETFTVLDYKFPGSDNLKKMRTDGPSQQYMTQVQLYGLGHERAGRRVDRVGLVALGRQGWLKDMWVHTVPYDREAALAAVKRIFTLGDRMLALGLPESGAWEQIERSPTRLCSWCPMWNRDEKVPSAKGCPGK
jgi:hypothetical protein